MLTRRDWAHAVTALSVASAVGCGEVQTGDPGTSAAPPPGDSDAGLLASTIVFDAHCDTPGRMRRGDVTDLSQRRPYHQVDIPRMREGGISASFFAVFTSAGNKSEMEAVREGLEITDLIVETVRKHPEDLAYTATTEEIRAAKADGKIAVTLSLEGGHMIDGSLAVLRQYHRLGIRSMGLTHSKSTAWAQSAEDPEGPGGLTDFGKDVVRELTRLGILIDLAHAADQTFFDTIETTSAPVISSHTACRAVCDTERNMSDDMLKALAANGGVLAIGYYNGMIVTGYGKDRPDLSDLEAKREAIRAEFADDPERRKAELWKVTAEQAERMGPVPFERLVDHFEHAATVAGVDHVAFGSDLDAAGMMYPVDAQDIADTPKLIPALRARGFSSEDIAKMLGGNIMRILGACEALAEA